MTCWRLTARSHPLLGALLLVTVVAVLLQGAGVPHTHTGPGVGLYNLDHDGALLATLHGVATLSAAAPLVMRLPVVTVVAPSATADADSAPRPVPASRAPPAP
jgi:hypothetical protein